MNVFNDCVPLHFDTLKRIVPLKYVHLLADGICWQAEVRGANTAKIIENVYGILTHLEPL